MKQKNLTLINTMSYSPDNFHMKNERAKIIRDARQALFKRKLLALKKRYPKRQFYLDLMKQVAAGRILSDKQGGCLIDDFRKMESNDPLSSEAEN